MLIDLNENCITVFVRKGVPIVYESRCRGTTVEELFGVFNQECSLQNAFFCDLQQQFADLQLAEEINDYFVHLPTSNPSSLKDDSQRFLQQVSKKQFRTLSQRKHKWMNNIAKY